MTISPGTRDRMKQMSKGKLRLDKNTRLWFVFLLAISIYGGTFISTAWRIGTQQRKATQDRSELLIPLPSKTKSILDKPTDKDKSNSIADGDGGIESVGEKKTFVSYRLEYGKPYNIKYGQYTRCKLGITRNKFKRNPYRRVPLSKPLFDVLNVTTYLRTNLKIITVGDSVGMQFHQVLEEALEPPINDTRVSNADDPAAAAAALGFKINDKNQTLYHTVYQNAWSAHESVSAMAFVNGGGALAAFRMTGLLLEEGKDKPPPNAGADRNNGAGGWIPEHVRQLLNHNYYSTATTALVGSTGDGGGGEETATTTTTQAIESFDIMIFRIPHGWIKASLITRERLERAMVLARKLFGVRTVIIQTLFLNNNVKTMDDLTDMRETNRMIREIIEPSWKNKDLPDLLLMDFGDWVDQLTKLNAELAGMDTTSNANYTLQRLGCTPFGPSIAMICVERNVTPGSCKCTRNMMSLDGMHWCMETIGGRIIGGFACLMQCSLLDFDLKTKQSVLGNCQKRCNDQFMSLKKASSLDVAQ